VARPDTAGACTFLDNLLQRVRWAREEGRNLDEVLPPTERGEATAHGAAAGLIQVRVRAQLTLETALEQLRHVYCESRPRSVAVASREAQR